MAQLALVAMCNIKEAAQGIRTMALRMFALGACCRGQEARELEWGMALMAIYPAMTEVVGASKQDMTTMLFCAAQQDQCW